MAHETENYPAEIGANKIPEVNPELSSQGTQPDLGQIGKQRRLTAFFQSG